MPPLLMVLKVVGQVETPGPPTCMARNPSHLHGQESAGAASECLDHAGLRVGQAEGEGGGGEVRGMTVTALIRLGWG